MALAQMLGISRSLSAAVVRMLASMSPPMHTDRALEVGGPELAERGDVGGVGLDDVGEGARHLLDDAGVGVDAEDLVAQVLEGLAERAAEPAEADDEHLVPGRR
jgi:hypothetical protein